MEMMGQFRGRGHGRMMEEYGMEMMYHRRGYNRDQKEKPKHVKAVAMSNFQKAYGSDFGWSPFETEMVT